MNRRSFLGNAIAGLAASGFLTPMRGWAQATTNANGLNMPIGFQSYVFREEISQKPQETMGRLASYGYRTVEWCSPKGYQGPFTPLVKYSGKELKKITNDSGLETDSCHFTWNEIVDDNSLVEAHGLFRWTHGQDHRRGQETLPADEPFRRDGEERRHGCRIPQPQW
jgi:hypothetical protein